MTIRTPPKPPGYKAQWQIFGVLPTSQAQRKAVIAKFGMVCGECNRQSPHIEAEHTYPLWLVDRNDYPNCLRYWSIDNLTAICIDCHKLKTKREAKDRAKIKRITAKKAGKVSKWKALSKHKTTVTLTRSRPKRPFSPTPPKQLR